MDSIQPVVDFLKTIVGFLQTDFGTTVLGILAGVVGFYVGRVYKNKDERKLERERDARAERQRHFELLERYAVEARLAFGLMSIYYVYRRNAIAAGTNGVNEQQLTIINDLADRSRIDASDKVSALGQKLDEIRVRAREMIQPATKVFNELSTERQKLFQSNMTFNMAQIEAQCMADYEARLSEHKAYPVVK